MKREMNLASALHEALKFTDKGRRIKTVDFIHAAARLGIHMTPAEANYYILHWSGHRFRVIEEGRYQQNTYLMAP
ncbi:hypothetical protein [Serratia fonticola]|uniref:hypothetical protein n=1 Tax=Serratia fonticola TaxID=47917 RepID=UPI00301C2662